MDQTKMPSPVSEIAAAPADIAAAHFEAMLTFETDCWDVHASLQTGNPDFVLLDVRGTNAYAKGHVDGATSLPHRDITETRMSGWPRETLFVVYCNGPHCNGANRAAVRLANLGRPVKMMIGGIAGWQDEGFDLVT
jgi:rhodanese-related sulfurtransferase